MRRILMAMAGMVIGTAGLAAEYTVVTTVAMIGDVAREIAGEEGQVITLIRSGIDPHLYNPTRSDVQMLQGADVVIYVGGLLEGQMSTVLDSLGRRNRHIHALIDYVAERTADTSVRREFANDPHIWMDVGLWTIAAEGIAEALSGYDPAHRGDYMGRLRRYQARLRELDAYVLQAMRSVPERKRILVTAHDAFAYFGRAYGVRVEGVQGISTESEAGLRRINELIELIIERDAGVVFVESSVNDKNVRSLVEGARAQGYDVRIGGTLYSDAMGAAGSYEGTYIGMLDHNATTIAVALGGDVSWRGMLGELGRGR